MNLTELFSFRGQHVKIDYTNAVFFNIVHRALILGPGQKVDGVGGGLEENRGWATIFKHGKS
jgi:hypothetical protein